MVNFAPHMALLFRSMGAEAVYTPPVGSDVPCRAIRATKPLRYGSIDLPVEGLCLDLLRSEVTPEVGGAIAIGGQTYPVDVPPLPFWADQDPDGLRWRLLCGWGSSVTIRSVTGSGATQNPPIGSGFTIAANAASGAASVNIKATLATGQLRPGDRLTVGGQSYSITNTVSAVSNTFTGVAITPALAGAVATGDAVSFSFARDYAVKAAVVGYTAEQLMGGVQVGDRRLIVPAAALAAAGMTDEPKATDKVTVGNRANINVQVATAAYQAGAPVLWELTVRG